MLKDKIAFVTGGSGAIGSAIVRTMAREGCSVAYSYNSREDKARKIDTEMAASGLNVTSYKLDILDGKAATVLAETIEKDLGPIDILVNNAGTSQVMPFAMINEADWDSIATARCKTVAKRLPSRLRPLHVACQSMSVAGDSDYQ